MPRANTLFSYRLAASVELSTDKSRKWIEPFTGSTRRSGQQTHKVDSRIIAYHDSGHDGLSLGVDPASYLTFGHNKGLGETAYGTSISRN